MEHASPLILLAAVLVLGVGAQWLAWRLRLPSILLLLAFGFLAGPVSARFSADGRPWLSPNELFGDLLLPLVSLSVAIILFEGGLSLRLRELRDIGRPLFALLTAGAAITWVLTGLAAYWLLGMPPPLAALLGAILVVTGPTVIGPLLRHIRPTGKVGGIARWEGIVIDPIGAALAVLVFEVSTNVHGGAALAVSRDALSVIARTVFVGGGLGLLGAWVLAWFLREYWIPDTLDNPVVLMSVAAVFTAANSLQHESGLLAVTVMGVVLANLPSFHIGHIVEFKENVSVILIGSLFILLAARMEPGQITAVSWRTFAFVLALMLVVRPAAVFLSTAGSGLKWREKLLLSWLAPRGIVAAAVASVFALRLRAGDVIPIGQVAQLVPAVFLVIVVTVAVYGLTAFPLARRLGLAVADPQGVLIASAHPGARAIAHALKDAGVAVVMVDTNWDHVQAAKLEGIDCRYGNVLSPELIESLDLGGVGRFIALTPNAEVNSLAAWHFSDVFGRKEVYQLPPAPRGTRSTNLAEQHLHGRILFAEDATYENLDQRFEAGEVVKKTHLTEEFGFQQFKEHYGPTALPLFVLSESGRLTICTAASPPKPAKGSTLISLVHSVVRVPDHKAPEEQRA